MQEPGSMIQTKRVYEIAAGRTARRKHLLQVTQRDSGFGRDHARVEIRIGKAILDDIEDTRKQPIPVTRDRRRGGWRKQRTEEIIDRQLQVGSGWGAPRSLGLVGLSNKVEEHARGRHSAARVHAAARWRQGQCQERERTIVVPDNNRDAPASYV